jgi:hypothetical protein
MFVARSPENHAIGNRRTAGHRTARREGPQNLARSSVERAHVARRVHRAGIDHAIGDRDWTERPASRGSAVCQRILPVAGSSALHMPPVAIIPEGCIGQSWKALLVMAT